MKTFCSLGCAVLILALANASAVGGDDKIKMAGRAVLAEHKDAVISVKYAGFIAYEVNDKIEKQEFKGEATGTILSPNGLTALCLDTVMLGAHSVVDEKKNTVFTEFELLLGDGRKIPGRFVSKDQKLGVLFVAPTEKQAKLKYVRLEKRKAPEISDQLIMVNRLRENLNRQPEVAIGRVTAVVQKPQPALVSDFPFDGGWAVFDSVGRPVGFGVLRGEKNGTDAEFLLNLPRFVVLPAEALNIDKHLETIKRWEKDKK